MTDPKPQHLRAVPAGGGHRVDASLRGPEDVVSTPEESASELESPRASSPLATAGTQVSTAIARAVAEPIAHAALALTVGAAGAVVGGVTGRSWTGAGIGAGVNLFLLGMGMAVLGRTLSPQMRWAYLLLSLAGGGGAGYALWAGDGAGPKRR